MPAPVLDRSESSSTLVRATKAGPDNSGRRDHAESMDALEGFAAWLTTIREAKAARTPDLQWTTFLDEMALELAEWAHVEGAGLPRAMLMPDGGLRLAWHEPGVRVVLMLAPDGEWRLRHGDRPEIAVTTSLDPLVAALAELAQARAGGMGWRQALNLPIEAPLPLEVREGWMDLIDGMLERREFDKLGALLETLLPGPHHPDLLLTVLTSTRDLRQVLPAWLGLRDALRVTLLALGEDAEAELEGLRGE